MSARPDGPSICDTKPLATAGPDMRGTLILHAKMSARTHTMRGGQYSRMSIFHTTFFSALFLFPDSDNNGRRERKRHAFWTDKVEVPCLKKFIKRTNWLVSLMEAAQKGSAKTQKKEKRLSMCLSVTHSLAALSRSVLLSPWRDSKAEPRPHGCDHHTVNCHLRQH